MRTKLVTFAGFLGLLALLVKAYERWFFPRDPDRSADPTASIVAPADGRIVYVAAVQEGKVPISIKKKTEIPLEEIVKGKSQPGKGS